MRRGSKQKSLDGVSCSLLSLQENELVIDLLGKRCVSLCTTVVQLFMALPHTPSSWTLQNTGVLCFVKDNPNRSYFIRLFDIKASKLVWEQEIYNQFNYFKAKSFFHTFNADDCHVGLNFANEQEADCFFTAVDEKIRQRCKQLDKRNRKAQDNTEFPSATPNDFGNSPLPLENIQNQAASSKGKKEKKVKEKKNKKKATKTKPLIGAPSGFIHVNHVGMANNSIDSDLMNLLSRAGISEADMNDSETSQLIYDVLERSGGVEALQKELNQQDRPPPPPPSTRRTSLNCPSATIPSQARLGPLPPPPGGSQFNEGSRSSVKRTGPLPPPPSTASMPPRSGSLPPVPGGHSGPPPPLPGERALPSLPSRSGPLPPPPGRAGAPSPFHEGTRRESLPPVPGGHSGSMPPVPGGRSGPPPPCLPGRRTGPTPTPPSSHSLPPPPPSKTFFPPPSADFPPPPICDLPPPPDSFDSYTPPQTNYGCPSSMDSYPPPMPVNTSQGGPPPPPAPPPPPPPPAVPSTPVLRSSQPPPVTNTGGDEEGGGRGALLDQIRLGTKLKMVTASPNPPPSATTDSEEGIVGALMMVMQKRSQAIRPSDDEDEFDEEEDDDDEWD